MATVPSAETSTGGTVSSIAPPKTYTPAAFASSITACASRPTASHSPSGTTMAALGKEIRYLAMVLLLGTDGGRDQRCQAGQPASAGLVRYASSYALSSAATSSLTIVIIASITACTFFLFLSLMSS